MSTASKLLPHRSDERLAAVIATTVLANRPELQSVMDIGCGDGIVSSLIPPHWQYQGIDLSNASIYEQNTKDKRIIYSAPEELEKVLRERQPADAVLMLDVLEHTRQFSKLFELAAPLTKRYLIASLPNELFFLDRLRILAGKEHPAHSLDLIGLPEGFKHQYLINIAKARTILIRISQNHGLTLAEEWRRPLISKKRLTQPLLWGLRQFSSDQVWSMGSIFVFKRNEAFNPA